MLAELLPPEVIAVDLLGDDPDAYLLPAEEHLVAKAVAKRRREVTNARTCARRALAGLGIAETAIPRGPKGQPIWPTGVVGSITHTTGYVAAAVAHAAKVRSIGVDAEVHGALPDGVLSHIAFGLELTWLAGTSPCGDTPAPHAAGTRASVSRRCRSGGSPGSRRRCGPGSARGGRGPRGRTGGCRCRTARARA